jgi:simple sugar transport system ATP-binding protein
MDEPTAALGVRESARVEELILGLKDKGLTQIVVSHNLDHVFRLATRIAVMRLGRLVAVKGIEETSRAEVVGLVSGVEVDS